MLVSIFYVYYIINNEEKTTRWAPRSLNTNAGTLHSDTNDGLNKFTTLETKLFIYKLLLKPIWTYGLQLWELARKTNINKIQAFQNITLSRIANDPPYVSNQTLHNDIRMKSIEESVIYYKRFFAHLATTKTH